MTAGDYVTLGLLLCLAVAVWLGRRHGKARFAAAMAAARAEGGKAALDAYLANSAVAHGGSVALHIGHGGSVGTGRVDHDDVPSGDDDDDVIAAYLEYQRARRAAELRHVRPLHPSGLDHLGRAVGGVFDGVQRGQVPAIGHGEPVLAGDAGDSDFPRDSAPQVIR